jgi:hypothetical protein
MKAAIDLIRETMRAALLRRVEILEARSGPEALPHICYGWLKRMSPFRGERHVVVVKREPTGSPRIEWCSFEERAGPAPTDDTAHDVVPIQLSESSIQSC